VSSQNYDIEAVALLECIIPTVAIVGFTRKPN